MNDQEFELRATANPFDESSEFCAAVQESPEREKMLNELKEFEAHLGKTLGTVNASANLKQRLLDLPEAEASLDTTQKTTQETLQETPGSNTVAANDAQLWTKRYLPLAACLLLAVGAAIAYWPAQKSALELEIFAHIYFEESYLEVQDVVPMAAVNQKMADTLGIEFKQSLELANLKVHVADDCWVAKENSIHMVIDGNVGAVSVLVLPNSPIKEELSISDDRFDGLITPTPDGNLVVVGEKGEEISEFSNLLADNISW